GSLLIRQLRIATSRQNSFDIRRMECRRRMSRARVPKRYISSVDEPRRCNLRMDWLCSICRAYAALLTSRRNKGNQLRAPRKFNGTEKEAAAERSQHCASAERTQRVLATENAVDAMDQLGPALPCSQRKSLGATFKSTLGKAGQACGISTRRMRNSYDTVVAGHLTLAAEPMLNPKQRGIKREQNQAELLGKVRPIVVAAQMFGFMQHYLFEFAGCEPGKKPVGNKDARLEE